MSVTVECKECGKKLAAPDDLRGKSARCSCGAVVQVPAAAGSGEAAGDQARVGPRPGARQWGPKRRPAAGTRGAPPPAGRRRVSERYQQRVRQDSRAVTYIAIGGAALAVVIIVVAIASGRGGQGPTGEPPQESAQTAREKAEEPQPVAGTAVPADEAAEPAPEDENAGGDKPDVSAEGDDAAVQPGEPGVGPAPDDTYDPLE
jgi:hypothetical protein